MILIPYLHSYHYSTIAIISYNVKFRKPSPTPPTKPNLTPSFPIHIPPRHTNDSSTLNALTPIYHSPKIPCLYSQALRHPFIDVIIITPTKVTFCYLPVTMATGKLSSPSCPLYIAWSIYIYIYNITYII